MTEARDKIILETIWRRIFFPKPNGCIKKNGIVVQCAHMRVWKMKNGPKSQDHVDVEFMRAWSEKNANNSFSVKFFLFLLGFTFYATTSDIRIGDDNTRAPVSE